MAKEFEKEAGRRLNERRLQPSQDAWERVQIQRGMTQKKKPFPWYWAAAVLVAGFGIWLLRPAPSVVITPARIVASPSEKKPSAAPRTTAAQNPVSEKQQQQVAAREATPIYVLPSAKKNVSPQAKPDLEALELSSATAAVERREIENRVTAAVMALTDAGSAVDRDDVDLLIEQARLEIAAGHGLSKPTDAAALLKDSESELDESFRAGIFENLFKHKKIKIALSGH